MTIVLCLLPSTRPNKPPEVLFLFLRYTTVLARPWVCLLRRKQARLPIPLRSLTF